MKKIIFGLIILFLLSGCTVNYELTIDNNTLQESININGEDEQDNFYLSSYTKPVEAFLNSPTNSETDDKMPGVEYYDMVKNSDELGNYHLNLNYNFSKEKFIDNNIINSSVSSLYYSNENGELSISTGLYIKAFNLYNGIDNLNVKINISDDYEIIDSNAHNQDGNILYWQVDRDNYQKSPIYLRLKDKNYKEQSNNNGNIHTNTNSNSNNNNKEDESNNNAIIIAFLSLFLFILVLIIIISFKFKKNNK